jgi:hypothetical protein
LREVSSHLNYAERNLTCLEEDLPPAIPFLLQNARNSVHFCTPQTVFTGNNFPVLIHFRGSSAQFKVKFIDGNSLNIGIFDTVTDTRLLRL